MRIERINENSISCTLTSFDLSVRNLNIRELAYGSEKARKLFNEMMSKASSEVGFNVENTPIMIEAIPMGSNSIKLIISKVPDPEELDARFSRFTQNPAGKAETDSWLGRLTAALLEGAGGLPGLYEISSAAKAAGVPDTAQETDTQAGTVIPSSPGSKEPDPDGGAEASAFEFRAFGFDDLDDVIKASGEAGGFNVTSSLYKNPSDGEYVLVVKTVSPEEPDFSKACNVIAEFGRMIRTVPNSVYYYEEHYKPIVPEDAIARLALI